MTGRRACQSINGVTRWVIAALALEAVPALAASTMARAERLDARRRSALSTYVAYWLASVPTWMAVIRDVVTVASSVAVDLGRQETFAVLKRSRALGMNCSPSARFRSRVSRARACPQTCPQGDVSCLA